MSILECERRQLEKFSLLAPKYKKVGWTISILSFLVFFLIRTLTEGDHIAASIAGKLTLLGLLLISISKEEKEDERMIQLRARSYSFAFIAVVLYALLQPYINLGVEFLIRPGKAMFEEIPIFVVLWFMLVVQIAYFHLLKRTA